MPGTEGTGPARAGGGSPLVVCTTMVDVDRLVLVRHALPELEPEVRTERWQLGAEGRAAARSLRSLVAEPAYLVASMSQRRSRRCRSSPAVPLWLPIPGSVRSAVPICGPAAATTG